MLQLLRHSVGRPVSGTSLDLRAVVFDTKEKIWTRFPSEGSKHTPPQQSCEFKWKDYCPDVFRPPALHNYLAMKSLIRPLLLSKKSSGRSLCPFVSSSLWHYTSSDVARTGTISTFLVPKRAISAGRKWPSIPTLQSCRHHHCLVHLH